MDPNRARPEAWDLNDDDIASIDSDELHRHRPNRWTGPASTWRGLTEEERLLWRSMKRIADQDLAVHLYNTLALKRRAADAATVQDVTVRLADGREIIWVPPKVWTAWPIEAEKLPQEDLVARHKDGEEDEDDEFTYHNREAVKMPSSDLQDELTATVLRLAKRRFRRRTGLGRYHEYQHGQATRASWTAGNALQPSPGAEISDTDTDQERTQSQRTKVEEGNTPDSQGGKRKRAPPRSYRAAVSTDDDRSNEILAPPVRHILSQMDRTLQILHTLRANCVSYQSDSSTDAESDSSHSEKQKKQKKPREQQRRAAETQTQTQIQAYETAKPPAGSSDDDHHSEDNLQPSEPRRRASSAHSEADVAFESWLRAGDETTSQLASDTEMKQGDDEQENLPSGDQAPSRTGPRRHVKERLRLRDWSDVIGAAAVAGFPPSVIARTTRRCADLFGEGMVLRRLEETPASHRTVIQTTQYRPEPITLSPSEWDESSDGETGQSGPHSSSAPSPALQLRRHILSRQASLSPSPPLPPPTRSRSRSPSQPASVSKSRSRSRTRPLQVKSSPSPLPRSRSGSRSSVGQHFCPVPSCERSVSGFSRRANLKRHTDLVHGRLSDQVVAMDADTDEEVVGAVHVDGFLKTLMPGRGWRGEDVMPRKRRGRPGQRRGHEVNTATRDRSTEGESST